LPCSLCQSLLSSPTACLMLGTVTPPQPPPVLTHPHLWHNPISHARQNLPSSPNPNDMANNGHRFDPFSGCFHFLFIFTLLLSDFYSIAFDAFNRHRRNVYNTPSTLATKPTRECYEPAGSAPAPLLCNMRVDLADIPLHRQLISNYRPNMYYMINHAPSRRHPRHDTPL
jgi:hypothetical protein